MLASPTASITFDLLFKVFPFALPLPCADSLILLDLFFVGELVLCVLVWEVRKRVYKARFSRPFQVQGPFLPPTFTHRTLDYGAPVYPKVGRFAQSIQQPFDRTL